MTETTESKQRFKNYEELRSYIQNTFIPQILIDRENAFTPFYGEEINRQTCWLREMAFKGKLNGEIYSTEIAKSEVHFLSAVNSAWIYKKRELSAETKQARYEKEMAKLKAKYGITD